MLVQLSYGGEVEDITGQNEIIIAKGRGKNGLCSCKIYLLQLRHLQITWNYVPHMSCGDLKIT